MKFENGLLSEEKQRRPSAKPIEPPVSVVQETPPTATPQPGIASPTAADDGHLFETLEKETSGGRKYLKLFSVVVVFVIVAGIAIGYFTLPGVGDTVRAPAGLEMAVRDHFLTKEKRTTTNIVFYQCEGFYSARVGVETRNDLPNPIFRIDAYTARAAARGDQWEITAAPIASGEQFVPCR